MHRSRLNSITQTFIPTYATRVIYLVVRVLHRRSTMWSRLNVTSGRARGPVAGLATPPLDQLPPGLVAHSVVVRCPQVRRIIVLTVQNIPVKGSRGVGVRVSTCTAAVTSRQRMIHTARRETGDNRYSLCLISELMRLHIRTQSVPACECFLVFLCALGHTTRVLHTCVHCFRCGTKDQTRRCRPVGVQCHHTP